MLTCSHVVIEGLRCSREEGRVQPIFVFLLLDIFISIRREKIKLDPSPLNHLGPLEVHCNEVETHHMTW